MSIGTRLSDDCSIWFLPSFGWGPHPPGFYIFIGTEHDNEQVSYHGQQITFGQKHVDDLLKSIAALLGPEVIERLQEIFTEFQEQGITVGPDALQQDIDNIMRKYQA